MANETVRSLAEKFVRSGAKYDCNPGMTVHDRWTNTLILCPFMRDKNLYDDVDDAMHDVFRNGSYEDLFGMQELVLLRWRFYTVALNNKLGLSHVNEYEANAAYFWMRRLADRIEQVLANKKKSRRAPPVKLKHDWLH